MKTNTTFATSFCAADKTSPLGFRGLAHRYDWSRVVCTPSVITTTHHPHYYSSLSSQHQSLYVLDTFRCPKGNTLPASGITVLQSAAVLVGDQLPVTLNKEGQFYFADLGMLQATHAAPCYFHTHTASCYFHTHTPPSSSPCPQCRGHVPMARRC